MGDISREPLPGGARSKGPSGKGPAEVIRLDELTVEERMETPADSGESPRPVDDPAARGFPSPRMAPAAPLRLEPFGHPPDGGPPPDGDGLPAEPIEVAERPRELLVDEPAVTVEEPLAVESEVLAEVPPEVAPEAVDADEPASADPDGSDAEDPNGIAVPDVEDLVSDEEAAPARAEPMLAIGLGEDSDDAPALTDPGEVARVLFSILLCSREALSEIRLAEVCNSTQKAVLEGLERLEQILRDQGLPVELLRVGDGVRLTTAPVVYPYLTRLKKLKKAEKLSPAALETLAVIAYRQPAIRLEIEAIRGVKVGPMLRSLLDHKLVKVVGRAEVPGRPLQYGTTQVFLDRFGLRSLKDLPSVQEFRSLG